MVITAGTTAIMTEDPDGNNGGNHRYNDGEIPAITAGTTALMTGDPNGGDQRYNDGRSRW